MSLYTDLTSRFNSGRLRAVLSSGQAVVFHRLALMSKDGDWILREDEEAIDFVLNVLAARGGFYRFGAPLDLRWLRHGWSAHLEFRERALRIRTDFVTRPPRIDQDDLAKMWTEQEDAVFPVLDVRRLMEIKKTDREKDYAIIGELARRLTDPIEKALYSRSARDLLALKEEFPDAIAKARVSRPALVAVDQGRSALEAAFDQERRGLMLLNEERLERYGRAAQQWTEMWPSVSERLSRLPLRQAHAEIIRSANGVLPFAPSVK